MDPIHQFQINKFVTLFHVAGREIAFTNAAFCMAPGVSLIALLLIGGTRRRALVPGAVAVARRDLLRVHRHDAPQQCRRGRHEVLPLRVHALHVHSRTEPDRNGALRLHGHQPHRHHGGACGAGLSDRRDPRFWIDAYRCPKCRRAIMSATATCEIVGTSARCRRCGSEMIVSPEAA